MRTVTTALAVLFLAGAALPVLAEPGDGARGGGRERAHERSNERGHQGGHERHDRGGREGGWNRGGQAAAETRQAPEAPRAREPGARREWSGRRDGGDPPVARDGDGGRQWRDRRDGDARPPVQERDGRRWDNDLRGDRGDADRNDRRANDGRDRRWGDRRGDDRRWDDRRDGGRWDRGDRWERDRYPRSYRSTQRYRYDHWRRPSGFYVRLWNYGEILPRGWYGPDWYIDDPWAFGLPLPPPGFDWVRVGDDAVLVDHFTGRIVQVVRLVFW